MLREREAVAESKDPCESSATAALEEILFTKLNACHNWTETPLGAANAAQLQGSFDSAASSR
jgi:hypothetical protein